METKLCSHKTGTVTMTTKLKDRVNREVESFASLPLHLLRVTSMDRWVLLLLVMGADFFSTLERTIGIFLPSQEKFTLFNVKQSRVTLVSFYSSYKECFTLLNLLKEENEGFYLTQHDFILLLSSSLHLSLQKISLIITMLVQKKLNTMCPRINKTRIQCNFLLS